VGRIVGGLLEGGKVSVDWQAAQVNWPKDWAKLLMNATLLAADSLPRGGHVKVETSGNPTAPAFTVRASGQNARVLEEVEKAVRGEPVSPMDGRSIQPFLTHKLARSLNAGLNVSTGDGTVELVAG
jgi:histidine phosphotransferase ChpT